MALSVINNVTSVAAQNNLTRTSNALSKSLERLSSGLKVNRGADGPAALVISEQQRAQIAGLRTAIDNSNKAVSLVQTSEGALNEINGLLSKARALALDSSNSGVNDANALAANQAEISNILSTIDTIAGSTQFGTKRLLNGAAQDGALTTTVTGVSVSGGPTVIPNLKTFTFNVTDAADKARSTAAGGFAGAGSTLGAGNAGNLTVNGTAVALLTTDTVDSSILKINNTLSAAGVNVRASNNGGQLVLTGTDYATNINTTGSTAATLTGLGLPAAGTTTFDGATLTYVNSSGATVTVNADAGQGNRITLTGELAGAVVTLGDSTTPGSISTVAPTNGTFTVGEKLTFQIGANANQTVNLSIDKVSANSLGVGAIAGINSLADINVTTTTGAQNALSVVDKAITDISTLRGRLGAFQENTLESNTNSLRTTLENTINAESIIRDTDFAEEIAQFTKQQVLLQAGSTTLGNANQIPQLVASLLRA